VTLSAFVSEKRNKLFAELLSGARPSEGDYPVAALKEALVKGKPQMGTTRFEPSAIVLEFIYPDPKTSATIVPIRIEAPERILFMPVPDWVVESIWQGEIDGTYHFETEAAELLAKYARVLEAEDNAEWFGERSETAKRKA
jgi:hypothetical protein